MLVTTISFAISAVLQKLPFDPIKDFAPITELASLPLILVVHPSLPATNLKEFIEIAKSKPAGWDFASSGVGTSPHLAAEMFKSMAGIDLVHVPYKGNAEAMNALLGGHIKIYFALVPAVLQHVNAGTLRPLAVTTEKRLPYLPDVPTIAESGLSRLRDQLVAGRVRPGGTPKDIVAKINGELVRMLKTPEVQPTDLPGGRRPGRKLARAIRRTRAERDRQVVEKWPSKPASRPRIERLMIAFIISESPTATSPPCAISNSPSSGARCSASSAPTAPARPPPSAC